MVSSKGTLLPLLMVKGSIKCLNSMKVEDFESFIPFMTKCAANGGDILTGIPPAWWPPDSVEYTFPMHKPPNASEEKYRRMLRLIVSRCYNYHNEDNILLMSSKLSQLSQMLELKDNGNGMTSIYCANRRLLVFQNVQKNYDRQPITEIVPPKSHRRLLLPPKNVVKEITSIYLCDYCDEEFTTQSDIATHERLCYGGFEPQDEPESTTPADLLGYLNLGPANNPKPSPSKERPKMILIKNSQFEFSSSFGQSLLQNRFKKDVVGNAVKCVQQYELFCNASQRIGKSRDNYELRTLFKTLGNKNQYEHCHQYSFTRSQRLSRYAMLKLERNLVLKTGLDAPSRALFARMKKCSVRLRKCVLDVKPSSEPMIIDLCSSDDDC